MNTEEIRERFAARLIEALDDMGIEPIRRASTLARWVGKDTKNPAGTRKWLSAQSIPQKVNLLMVAVKLGVRPEWLEYGDGAKQDSEEAPMSQEDRRFIKKYRALDDGGQRAIGMMIDELAAREAKKE